MKLQYPSAQTNLREYTTLIKCQIQNKNSVLTQKSKVTQIRRNRGVGLHTWLGTSIAMNGSNLVVSSEPYELHIVGSFPLPMDHLDDVPMASVCYE